MKKQIFVFTLAAILGCFFLPAIGQKSYEIENAFSENKDLFKEKSGVFPRFEPSWLCTDSTQLGSYTYSYQRSSDKPKVYAQVKKRGFRVGTITTMIEMYKCTDYFYVYLHTQQVTGVFFIDHITGNGGYVVPDTSGSIYLNHWGSLGFSSENPPVFFSYMPKEQVIIFNGIVEKFISCAQKAKEKARLSKLKVIEIVE
jgi:hypothetical protein